MPSDSKFRIILFLSGLIFVPVVTVLVIYFARGYRPDFTTGQIQPTGLLVAHSYPDGAQVYLNGSLKSATNSTLNLPPGTYQVQIKKDGYHSWQKKLLVEAEVVTRATAVLFPSTPTLKAITTTGATLPALSPDGTKVAYIRTPSALSQIYTLDITESPLGLINRESKLIATLPANHELKTTNYELLWSPDSRQILIIVNPQTAYLVTPSDQQSPIQTANAAVMQNTWTQSQKVVEAEKFRTLPVPLKDLLASASARLVWSPKENRLLYTATASAILADNIIKPLLGSSTQPQERQLSPGGVYVYDLEEDRNFKIDQLPLPTPAAKSAKNTDSSSLQPENAGWSWFPTSSHLLKVEANTITIMEYDGQTPAVVYTGPLSEPTAIPYPSAKQLLILTNLQPTPAAATPSANLYAISLR